MGIIIALLNSSNNKWKHGLRGEWEQHPENARNHYVSLEHRDKMKIIKAFQKGQGPEEEKNERWFISSISSSRKYKASH